MTELLLDLYKIVGPTWKELLWDLIPLTVWLWLLIKMAVSGARIHIGATTAMIGLLLLSASAALDVIDEITSLAEVDVIGRMSPWHESIETVLFVAGVLTLGRAIGKWIKYA